MILGFTKVFYVDRKRKLTNFEDKIKDGIKLHTIRSDPKRRWKPGRKIHFATGVRTSRYNNFKVGECISTQYIIIVDRKIWIDNRLLDESEIEYLAHNDGFDSVTDFWSWFDQYLPFEGSLIHWTDLRY